MLVQADGDEGVFEMAIGLLAAMKEQQDAQAAAESVVASTTSASTAGAVRSVHGHSHTKHRDRTAGAVPATPKRACALTDWPVFLVSDSTLVPASSVLWPERGFYSLPSDIQAILRRHQIVGVSSKKQQGNVSAWPADVRVCTPMGFGRAGLASLWYRRRRI